MSTMRAALGGAGLLLFAGVAAAQVTSAVSVQVSSEGLPLAHATVRSGDRLAQTNAAGLARLALAPGRRTIRITLLGYSPDSVSLVVNAARDTLVSVELTPIASELSGIVVTSARGAQRIESEPMRVEVLEGDDVAEKTEMRPSDLRNFLAEMAGVRIQQLSAASGASSVRLQGLRPRYTLLLADGLPLYGSSGGGLDLLQLPPADLRQIEVVKGPASALYGASALGGMINLISKRPGHEGDVLLQATNEGGFNSFGWLSRQSGQRAGATLVVGEHFQDKRDIDGDGWTDLPGVQRQEFRPRLFYTFPGGHSLFITAGGTRESRSGGFINPSTAPAIDSLKTWRGDVGLVGQRLVGTRGLVQLRAAYSGDKTETFAFGQQVRASGFGELSYTDGWGKHELLTGTAIDLDGLMGVPANRYNFTTASVFMQDAWQMTEQAAATASARLDNHSRYGSHVSPRLSFLFQLPKKWSVRASATHGFFAPTPLVEVAEEVGVSRMRGFARLGVETADYAGLDVNGKVARVDLNATVFGSRVHHQVTADPDDVNGVYLLNNATAIATSRGAELFGVYDFDPLFITALYTFTDSREPVDTLSSATRRAPYVPRHSGGVDVTWEDMTRGTWIAVEAFYTGVQPLDRDPYLAESKPYTIVGILATQRIGRFKVFANVENLTDVRQRRYAPVLLPTQRPTGEWTTGIWAPLEGRVYSIGLRVSSGDLVPHHQ